MLRWPKLEVTAEPGVPSMSDLARAARVLDLRARRQSSGGFAGAYASAFRGAGMVFEESVPYVPGDDIRHLDWNATARSGVTHVKRFREERVQNLLLALDVSASMRFGTSGRSKAIVAAHCLGLLATAASRTGDRVGLTTHAESVRSQIPPASGAIHVRRIIEAAVRDSEHASGGTRFGPVTTQLMRSTRHATAIVLISDFYHDAFTAEVADRLASIDFAELGRSHDVVSIVVVDPRECALPRVGRVRVRDPENPARTWLLETSSDRARERYERARTERERVLRSRLHRAGCDVVRIDTRDDPLRVLSRFFRWRAARLGGAT